MANAESSSMSTTVTSSFSAVSVTMKTQLTEYSDDSKTALPHRARHKIQKFETKRSNTH